MYVQISLNIYVNDTLEIIFDYCEKNIYVPPRLLLLQRFWVDSRQGMQRKKQNLIYVYILKILKNIIF
jgi:hypothetical protein